MNFILQNVVVEDLGILELISMIINDIFTSSKQLEFIQEYLDKHDDLWISSEQVIIALSHFDLEINDINLNKMIVEDGSITIEDENITFLTNDVVENLREEFYDRCIDLEKNKVLSECILDSLDEDKLQNNIYQYYSFEEDSDTNVINLYVDIDFESEYYVEIN